MPLDSGDKYRMNLRELGENLYADVYVTANGADVVLFEGDRMGAQYGSIVTLTPQVETFIKGVLADHGFAGNDIVIYTDRNAFPGRLPELPAVPARTQPAMQEFYFFDMSLDHIPRGTPFDTAAEKKSRANESVLRDHFNSVVKNSKLEDRVMVSPAPIIGYGPAMLQVYTDDATAQKIERASNGRLKSSKVELH